MGEAVHYEWSPSPTNNRDSGLLPQATRPISGSGLPVVGTGDSDLVGDISSHSQDSDENSPSGDLKFDELETSPDAHDESPPQSEAASTQAPGTGAAEEGVNDSCEDEASGDAAAAAPEAAADDEDDDSDSNFGHLVYDVVHSGQESTVTNAETTSAEPHDAHAAAGELAEKHKVERQGRSRWMGPLAGDLETAGKKITSVVGKSYVSANPRVGGLSGEAASSSSKASQPVESRGYRSKLALGDSNSPHYKDLGKPYDFPNLKADNYAFLRAKLLMLQAHLDSLCSPHDKPFQAKVEADCNIPGVGTVTLHIEIVEEDVKNQNFLSQFARDLLALIEELSLKVLKHAQQTKRMWT
ncbi:hypothetical protein, conserved [Eimeria necatrix]|uniref:Uncharacterized protein n=1 Tax=Eimeria necatrix TaxID=51315 RepID=U6MW63_9EIME|nr:hypothetical protein, conserved [Eimeria necatrix]CDJ67243.1 hypothetical protein, conserved [Eimeria necatrix]